MRVAGGPQPVGGLVAISTAVEKPKVKSVASRSLSMVLGTPTIGMPSQPCRGCHRAVAADGDHAPRLEFFRTFLDDRRAHRLPVGP